MRNTYQILQFPLFWGESVVKKKDDRNCSFYLFYLIVSLIKKSMVSDWLHLKNVNGGGINMKHSITKDNALLTMSRS